MTEPTKPTPGRPLHGRPDETPCWQCGTSENRWDECGGCKAARRAEQRRDEREGD